jgi:hypothetical protein
MKRLLILTTILLGLSGPAAIARSAPAVPGPPACQPAATPEEDAVTHFATRSDGSGSSAGYVAEEGPISSLLTTVGAEFLPEPDLTGGTATFVAYLGTACRGATYGVQVFGSPEGDDLLGTASFTSDGTTGEHTLDVTVTDHQGECVYVVGVGTYRDVLLDDTLMPSEADPSTLERFEACHESSGGRTMF